jgi:hypothetical protein
MRIMRRLVSNATEYVMGSLGYPSPINPQDSPHERGTSGAAYCEDPIQR